MEDVGRTKMREHEGGRLDEEEGMWRRLGKRGGFDQSQGGFDQNTNNDTTKIGMIRLCMKYLIFFYAQ